jgi:hypothetical protein
MMRQDINGFPPFGDDEDANRAVARALRIGALLAEGQAKLAAMKTPNLNAQAAQRQRVEDLLAELHSRADSVHVDRGEFLAAVTRLLSKRSGKPVAIAAVTPSRNRQVDEEGRRLEAAVMDAEQIEADRLRRLTSARNKHVEAQGVAAAARAALAAHHTGGFGL